MTLLAAEQVYCHFRTNAGTVRALDGVSLAIDPGETLALVGESGCGKSTFAKVILNLAPLSAGRIVFDGQDITQLNRRQRKRYRRRVQAVFQDPYSSLNPRLRVESILTEPLKAHGQRGAALHKRMREVLDMVGLPQTAARLYPHEFSGGQRQRIAIARSLMLAPDLIVLDEPISALDVSIRAQILNLLQDIQRELNLAYVLIAHDLALVAHASQRVAVMYLGRIVEYGPTAQLFDHPAHPYTQALLRAVPQPDPGIPRRPILGEIASALSPPSGCHFHPRCPRADQRCATETPETQDLDGVQTLCWLPGPD